MIRDNYLSFARNQRPTFAAVAGVKNPGIFNNTIEYWAIPFPDTFVALGGSPIAYDFQTVEDFGRGNPLTMRFQITTTFTGAAANTATFGIIVADSSDLVTNPFVIAQGPPISTAGLAAGTFVDVILPPLPSIARLSTLGRRWIGAVIYGYVPVSDWTAGGVDVSLMLNPPNMETYPVHTSGFSV